MKKRNPITVPAGLPDRWETCPDCKAKKLKGSPCKRSACPSGSARNQRKNS